MLGLCLLAQAFHIVCTRELRHSVSQCFCLAAGVSECYRYAPQGRQNAGGQATWTGALLECLSEKAEGSYRIVVPDHVLLGEKWRWHCPMCPTILCS